MPPSEQSKTDVQQWLRKKGLGAFALVLALGVGALGASVQVEQEFELLRAQQDKSLQASLVALEAIVGRLAAQSSQIAIDASRTQGVGANCSDIFARLSSTEPAVRGLAVEGNGTLCAVGAAARAPLKDLSELWEAPRRSSPQGRWLVDANFQVTALGTTVRIALDSEVLGHLALVAPAHRFSSSVHALDKDGVELFGGDGATRASIPLADGPSDLLSAGKGTRIREAGASDLVHEMVGSGPGGLRVLIRTTTPRRQILFAQVLAKATPALLVFLLVSSLLMWRARVQKLRQLEILQSFVHGLTQGYPEPKVPAELQGRWKDIGQALWEGQARVDEQVRTMRSALRRATLLARLHLTQAQMRAAPKGKSDPHDWYRRAVTLCAETLESALVMVVNRVGGNLEVMATAGAAAGEVSDAVFLRYASGAFKEQILSLSTPHLTSSEHPDFAQHPIWAWAPSLNPTSCACLGLFPFSRGGKIGGVLLIVFHEFEPAALALQVSLVKEVSHDLGKALDLVDREWERKRALKEAQSSSKRFLSLFESIPVPACVVTHPEQRIVLTNNAFHDFYVTSAASAQGKPLAALAAPDINTELALLEQKMASMADVRDVPLTLRTADGTHKHVLRSIAAIEYSGVSCMLCIDIDVTERRNAELVLEHSERHLAGIVHTAMDSIVSVDANLQVIVFNNAAAKLFEYDVDEVLGAHIRALLPRRRARRYERLMLRILADDEQLVAFRTPAELRVLRGGHTEVPVEVTATKHGLRENATLTFTVRDLTERLFAKRARFDQKIAVQANQAKTTFLAKMSHELRNPLNAVLGFSHILRATVAHKLSPTELNQLDQIFIGGNQLRALIDDVQDVSRIEAGTLRITQVPCEVGQVVQEAIGLSNPQAQAHDVQLIFDSTECRRTTAYLDPLRVRQVLLNLISNAIKYNIPNGQVYVNFKAVEGRLHILVRDTGIGMSSEQLQRLYKPFDRLGREKTHLEGTGIGMMLSRELVHAMGGTMEVDSTVGEGTSVALEFPHAVLKVESTEEILLREIDRDDQPVAAHVLYIEDNAVNAMLVEDMLSRLPGVQVSIAEDGAKGLACAKRIEPDLVLLDLHLPDINGYEVLEKLKENPQTREIPVIVLSASSMPDDVAKAVAKGAAFYWTKPLELESFTRGVSAVLKRSAPRIQ